MVAQAVAVPPPPVRSVASMPSPVSDPMDAAKQARLRYVSDAIPGVRRRRTGAAWSYTSPDGSVLRDAAELRRIKSLVIPPAWTDVWISPHANGHIQATGRDARGRKQYRYHTRWHDVRDETKFGRMVDFGRALSRIRERTDEHLALSGLPREKVLATVVRLLEGTLIRIGNGEYARNNESYGLTTMNAGHADVDGSTIRFSFRGKSGKQHEVGVRDRRLARIVRRCQELPGEDLFQYVDAGANPQTINSADVNEYLREIGGADFTAKDFRTWAGTVLAAMALHELGAFETETEAKRNVVQAVEQVAEKLGNTRAVARKSYIHPAVIDAYLDGTMLPSFERRTARETGQSPLLADEESAVLAFLQRRLAAERATG